MSSVLSESVVSEVFDPWETIDAKHEIVAHEEQYLADLGRSSTASINQSPRIVYFTVKRAFDIFGSLVGILLSSPFLVIAAILIWVEDRGPVFFAQTRIGKDGRAFRCFKLRTMVPNADALKAKLLS